MRDKKEHFFNVSKVFLLKQKIAFVVLVLFVVSMYSQQCPSGSTVLVATSNLTINSGEVYCASASVGVSNLTVKDGGELYILPGVLVTVGGTFTQEGGLVEIYSEGGLSVTGSANIGQFGSQKDAVFKLNDDSFFTIKGSLNVNDPSQGGFYSTGVSQIHMGNCSVVEVCATFTQQSTTYPGLKLTGDGSCLPYFINRAQVSAGSGSVLADGAQLNWIAMNSVTSLATGGANFCGPNANKSTCDEATDSAGDIWPNALSSGSGSCFQALDVVKEISCTYGASKDGNPTIDDVDGDGVNNKCDVDNDNDGVPDLTDLDDDNDGILDADETGSCNDAFIEGYSVVLYDGVSGQNSWNLVSSSNTFPVTGFEKLAVFDYDEFDKTPNGFLIDFEEHPYNLNTSNDGDVENYEGEVILNDNSNSDSALVFSKMISQEEAGIYDFDIDSGDDHIFLYVNGIKQFQAQNAYNTYSEDNNFTNALSNLVLNAGDVVSVVVVVEGLYNTKIISEFVKTANIGGGSPTCPIDTDNDGIPNHLDLDSDGDGCPDAVESGLLGLSGVTLSAGNVLNVDGTTSTTIDNAVVNGLYGNNGLANSLEGGNDTNTANTAYTSTYEDYALKLSKNYCQDSDNDDVPDFLDLDDDNDGVLDTEECVESMLMDWDVFGEQSVTAGNTATYAQTITGTSKSISPVVTIESQSGTVSLTESGFDRNPTSDKSGILFDISGNQAPSVQNKATIDFKEGIRNVSFVVTDVDGADSVILNGYLNNVLVTLSPYNVSPVSGGPYPSQNGNTFSALQAAGAKNTFKITYSNNQPIDKLEIIVKATSTTNPRKVIKVYSVSFQTECDTDKDEIPNHLDLDSDGDGCPDAKESGVIGTLNSGDVINGDGTTNTNTTTDDAIAAGPYGGNGLADSLESGDDSTSATTSYTSTYADYALNEDKNYCQDNDNDGVPDFIDIDDDNDGVLDTEEGFCYTAPVTFIGDTYDVVKSGFAHSDDIDYTQLQTNPGDPMPEAPAVFITGYDEAGGSGILTYTYTTPKVLNVDENGLVTVRILLYDNISNATGTYTASDKRFNLFTTSGTLTGHYNVDPSDYSVLDNGGWLPFTITYAVTPNTEITLTGFEVHMEQNNSGTPGAFNANASEVYALYIYPIAGCSESVDTDGDGILNHLDLDSDGDGCPDAKEAGVIGTLNSGDVVNGDGTTNTTVSTANAVAAAPYGKNGLANSLENNDEATATTGYTSTYTAYALSFGNNVCLDTDNDGVPNFVDIDDDNDGIIDKEECPLDMSVSNQATQDLTYKQWQLSKLTSSSSSFYTGSTHRNNGGTNASTGEFPLHTGAPTNQNVNYASTGEDVGHTNNGDFITIEGYVFMPCGASTIELRAHRNGTTREQFTSLYISVDNEQLTTDAADLTKVSELKSTYAGTGTPLIETTYTLPYGNTGKWTRFGMAISDGRTNAAFSLEWKIDGGTWDNIPLTHLSNTSQPVPTAVLCCDADGDGISNTLDLDSDGDGCPDAKEAGVTGTLNSGDVVNGDGTTNTNTTTDNAIAAGPYGDNGLVNSLEGSDDTDAATTSYTSTYTDYALNGGKNYCQDNDNDGVPDFIDIDDDNDGILDTDEEGLEEVCLDFSTISNGSPNFTGYTLTHSSGNTVIYNGTLTDENYSFGNAQNHTSTPGGNNYGDIRLGVITDNAASVTIGNYEEYTITFDKPVKLKISNRYINTGLFDDPDYWDIKVNTSSLTVNDTGAADLENIKNTGNRITFDGILPSTNGGTGDGIWEITTDDFITSITLKMSTITNSNNLSPIRLCALVPEDTDKDGVANYLDLDSDGDGCPDAKESGVTGTLNSGDVVNGDGTTNTNTTTDNAIAAGPYGDNGLANSLEGGDDTDTANTTYTSTYTDYALIEQLNYCVDTDEDGVPDVIDLDDDNDAILDIDEKICINRALSGTVSQSSTYQGTALASRANDGNTDGDYANDSVSHTNEDANAWWEIDLGSVIDISNINIFNRTGSASARLSDYHVFVSHVPFASTNINTTLNQSSVFDIHETTEAGYPTNIDVNRIGRYVRIQLSGTGFLALAEVEIIGCTEVDTDGDTIPNHLDLDSDGDGCPDALEGDGTFDYDDTEESSMPEGNSGGTFNGTGSGVKTNFGKNLDPTTTAADPTYGVPVVSPATTAVTQGIGSSQNQIVNNPICDDCEAGASTDGNPTLSDSDGDGINDNCDLDDDNDGILDEDEYVCNSVTVYEVNGTLGTLTGNTNAVNRELNAPTPANYIFGGTNTNNSGTDWPLYYGNTYVVTNGENAPNIHPSTLWDNIVGHTTGLPDDAFLAVNGADTQAIFYADDVVLQAGETYAFGVWVAYASEILSGSPSASEVTVRIKDASDNIVRTFDTGEIISTTWSKRASTFTPTVTGTYTFEVLNKTTHQAGNDFALDDFFLFGSSCRELDTDNDGIPNRLDLDSDGDGCPDAKEAGVTGTLNSGNVVNGDGSGNTANNTSTTIDNAIAAGPYGSNGLADNLEDGDGTDANVTYSLTYQNALNDNISIACRVDLRLTKTVSNALPKVGEDITYTITVTNNSIIQATGVYVTDVLPMGLSYVSDSTGGTKYNGGIWNIGILNSGANTTLTITATINISGKIVNIAEVKDSNQLDIDSTPLDK